LLAGVKDPSCAVCWKDEACGQTSKRQFGNHDFREEAELVLAGTYEIDQPIFLDISPGNLCNLKCRICAPGISSRWDAEADALGMSDGLVRNTAELRSLDRLESRKKIYSWVNEQFWSEVEQQLPAIKRLAFYGGEPFLNRRHFEVLERSVREGHAGRQTLRYNSNGTIFPAKAMESLFPEFLDAQVFLSIDDLGSRFEYQRHGAIWTEVLENTRKFLAQDKVTIGVCVTVSIFNVFSLFEILDFWRAEGAKVFLNLLVGPEQLRIKHLPAAAKKILMREFSARDLTKYQGVLLNRVEAIFQHLMEEGDPACWAAFAADVKVHDTFRKEDWKSVFPALAEFSI
jgi:hypothetical protein